ncbi:hypothetical protein H5410_032433 [Solanum commersonii]|uniref:Uncharacterized protein n=1 Tax=Solanum commersonii TaxID=4109 RepID=A0A9J5YMV4_SOLCO|nr:hypothetical protein H5410_032433 [Solanum commersonii]
MNGASSSSSSTEFPSETALMSNRMSGHGGYHNNGGASNHMVHSLSLMKQCKDIGDKSDMKVNLPTGAQVAISHVGDSLDLKVETLLATPLVSPNLKLQSFSNFQTQARRRLDSSQEVTLTQVSGVRQGDGSSHSGEDATCKVNKLKFQKLEARLLETRL